MYISNKLHMHACSVAQLFLTLWDPMDCSLQDSSAHGIFQARILEWAAISFSRGSSWPRDGTRISCVGRWILHHWAMKESQNYTWGALKFTQLFPGLKHWTFKMSQAKILEHVTSGLHFPIHIRFPIQFNSVQWLSHFQLFVTPWTTARQASLSITISQSPPKPKSIESVMPSSHLILCHPLLLLPSIFPNIRVFSNESALCIRWPKDWSFSFNISPANEHPGLISFRMDWLDLLAVQGTLKSLLQHHSSKASIFLHSALFTLQLSHPYTTTGKTIALTRRTFVGRVTSLLFNMLSRLVITFLPKIPH